MHYKYDNAFPNLKCVPELEPCADIIVSAVAHRSMLVGGGAPPVQKNLLRGAGGQVL